MIQDIAPHQYHNEYHPKAPSPDSYVLYYQEREVLVKWEEGQLSYPRFAELAGDNEGLYDQCRYLFTIDEERYYLADQLSYPSDRGFSMEKMEIFRGADPKYLAFAGITGAQLYRWYQSRRYCGHCAEPMVHSEKERMLYCPKCGLTEYPKLSPAVIVAITHGNRLLMSKYAGRGHNNYALIAGFAEIGETIEETVRREVMEEVGLKVTNLRFYKSQPWSFTDTLLFGFYVELDGTEDITLDREELAMAEWFEREEIPVTASRDSLTNEMIMKFKNGEV